MTIINLIIPKRLFVTALIFWLPFTFLKAQPPSIYWQHYYGGSKVEFRGTLTKTSDKGFVIAGHGQSTDGDFSGNSNNGQNDFELVRLDSCGNKIWAKIIGGNYQDLFPTVKETIEKGFLITGYTFSTNLSNGYHGGVCDAAVCKIDRNGNVQWIKTFGGSDADVIYNAICLPDSTYIIAGSTRSTDGDGDPVAVTKTGWLFKLDKNGNIIWKKFYGNYGSSCTDIQLASDGGFIICGGTMFPTNSDYWLLKIDTNGNQLWEKKYGGSGIDNAFCIRTTGSGNYLIAGISSSNDGDVTGNHGGDDAWIIETDINGNLLWQKSFGGAANEYINDITVLPDNSCVVSGYSNSTDGDITVNHGLTDAVAFSLNSNGVLLWTKVWGGSKRDEFYGVTRGDDNSILLSGFTGSSDGDIIGNHASWEFMLLKLRNKGTKNIDTISCKPILINNILVTHDTAFIDTLKDFCNYDSAYINYNILIKPATVKSIQDTTINRGEYVNLTTISSGPVTWSGTGLNCYNCLSPVAFPPGLTNTYIVKTANGSCIANDTVIINVKIIDTLFIPTAFTPNGDGKNDLFHVIGTVNEFSLNVYNRWGEVVFKSNSVLDGWDGTYKGSAQPSGVFIYFIKYKNLNNSSKQIKGALMLIR